MNTIKGAGDNGASWWQAALLIRGQTHADQRNIRIFSLWCLFTSVVFCTAIFTLTSFPGLLGNLTWLFVIIPLVLGVATIRSFLRLLRDADEFMRKVQLEGIAIGFGAGSLSCFGYYILELLGAPHLPVVFAIIPLTLGWAFGSLFVAARYR